MTAFVRRTSAIAATAVLVSTAIGARAEDAAPDEATLGARREFVAGTEYVKQSRWGEALASFERSRTHRSHALTTYNIGACERALGRYTRARAALRSALAQNDAAGGKALPQSFAEEARAWLDEIDRIVVVVRVTLEPADAELLVDGRPLASLDDAKDTLWPAPPDDAKTIGRPGRAFSVLLDPGTHVFSMSKKGFSNAVATRTYSTGERPSLALDLQLLPATIHVSATQPGAVVAVGGLDVGVAPIVLSRPAGSYPVLVRKSGFVPYTSTVGVKPGEEANLHAAMVPESTPIYARVWFWAAAAAVVAGAATTTYLLTRPEPQRPAPNGGGLGWVVRFSNAP